ncbi:peptidyl-alpha-hydroxyglycine alpha-amidating lyase 1 [Diaphorina citri]|uniref:peptidylamidoglycolate lyase n=1 Tax=Diaphorina citri TaxID=121845 RepID=A0A3Q0J3I4_DIACI|nr:peptidyl-alpha-hydroxyglycine alpha-amidating lyase 1 [Diaphorina citri]
MRINVITTYLFGLITLSYTDDNQYERSEKVERENAKTPPPITAEYHVVTNWPAKHVKYGQVSSVAYDSQSNVYVFHRGDRVWNSDTFYDNNLYKHRADGPIATETVLVLDPNTGHLVKSWGANMFYLPHGITIDAYDNIWITDVALHQVFKYPRLNSTTTATSNPLMTLGTAFTPGSSHKHFCKPTSVAVLPNGDFWVADGYCNARLIKFNSDGMFLSQIGRSTRTTGELTPAPYHFQVPHSMTLIPDQNILCVADRENGRLQCFDCHNGTFLQSLESDVIGRKIYGVSYSHMNGGVLYIVNGPQEFTPAVKIRGFVVDFRSQSIVSTFNPGGDEFHLPHDVISSDSGERLFVAEINPFRIWQFVRNDLNVTISDAMYTAAQPSASGLLSLPSLSGQEQGGALVLAVLVISAVLLVGIAVLVASFVYTKTTTGRRGKRRRAGSVEHLFLEETNLVH